MMEIETRVIATVESAEDYSAERFEPHHFRRTLWPKIGFAPGAVTPWRASLRIGPSDRRRMQREAQRLDPESAARATSFGAWQIMGFNHAACGYETALGMAEAFEAGGVEAQRAAFIAFCKERGCLTYLIARDWLDFAAIYNGSGQPEVYAAKCESAYRRITGRSSPVVLREGDSGGAVKRLQRAIGVDPADGHFGPATRAAVERYQDAHGLVADGIAGARTWAMIGAEIPEAPKPKKQASAGGMTIESGAKAAATILAPAGAALGAVDQDSVGGVIIIATVALVALVVAAVVFGPRLAALTRRRREA